MCEGKVELADLAAVELGEDCIFFIESSPKEVLSSREACALESAARNSELRVVMVRLGRSLDLADNTTCQVYNRYIFLLSLLPFPYSQLPRSYFGAAVCLLPSLLPDFLQLGNMHVT